MHEKIIIYDFGSQYTQLIARRVREHNIFCEIIPYHQAHASDWELAKGIILSGSPFSVRSSEALKLDLDKLLGRIPVLAICYGAQLIADHLGGRVEASQKREYGKALLSNLNDDPLWQDIDKHSQVWMSHADTIYALPANLQRIGATESIEYAAYRSIDGAYEHAVYGLQFHPEVAHSLEGSQILKNFLLGICGCRGDWTPAAFVEETVENLQKQIGNEKVLLGLSGGVDSSVAAVLLQKAIGDNLLCFFVDNGLLRKDEFEEVLASYQDMGLNIEGVRAEKRFWDALSGVKEPEKKRKIIGNLFVKIFEEESTAHPEVQWLGQGTIYPDVIESISVKGPSATIKSHHNVGGLPDDLRLKIIEPLRMLFKDEVRQVGKELGISNSILSRHPFPGPGLSIRILGEITPERVRLLQEADAIFVNQLKAHNLYDQVWQCGAILLPVKAVGVMGDERTYEQVVALRAVNSTDGMTADWSRLPYDFLAKVSTQIINNVKGINRVVYDISTKPPATIEWE